MSKFKSFFSSQINDYIMFQKASDRWNESSYEANLLLFDRYCIKNYPTQKKLTQEIVDDWCKKRPHESNNSCRSRIYVVVSFIRYLRNRNKTEITDPIIPRKESRVYIPHAFTELELKNFFYACDTLPNKPKTEEIRSRKISIPIFFRLLYSSGLRTNEARMLKVENVNLEEGVINIKYSKGHNQHYVVLHDSMVELLIHYNSAIEKLYPKRKYFFPSRDDLCHNRAWVQKNFRLLWDKYNSSYATAYQLRHNYAITNINSWSNDGFEINDKLLYLSKSMGHSNLQSTMYYYSLVPRLSKIIESNTESDFNDIVPEVNHEKY